MIADINIIILNASPGYVINWERNLQSRNHSLKIPPDLLRYFRHNNENNLLPAQCKPIALDLKSMYTNIPLEEGVEAFRTELEKREDKSIPTDFIIKHLRLVLECNVFELNEEFWIQLLGTAMGTRVAPTYANIFYESLGNKNVDKLPQPP